MSEYKQRHEQIDGAYLLGLLVMGLSGFVVGFAIALPL